MVRGGGAEKTDAELVAHMLATALISYNPVTTLVHGRELKEKDILKYTREQYRVYWKCHFEGQGHQQRQHKMSPNVAYAISDKDTTEPRTFSRNNNSKKTWKKFKGNCRKCGEQGHRANKCTKNTNSKENRRCYVCKQVGHISPNFPHKTNNNNNSNNKNETSFVGMLTNGSDDPIGIKMTQDKIMKEEYCVFIVDKDLRRKNGVWIF
jgi:hypothetical protein